MAAETELGPSTIRQALSDLRGARLIVTVKPASRYRPTEYRINLPALRGLPSALQQPEASDLQELEVSKAVRPPAGGAQTSSSQRADLQELEGEPRTEPRTEPSEGTTLRPGGRPRERDLLFDAIAEVCRVDPATIGPSIGKVRGVLLKASPPYTPAEVRLFGVWWWGRDGMRKRPPTLWQLQEQIGVVRSPDVGKAAPRNPHDLPEEIPDYHMDGYQVVPREGEE